MCHEPYFSAAFIFNKTNLRLNLKKIRSRQAKFYSVDNAKLVSLYFKG